MVWVGGQWGKVQRLTLLSLRQVKDVLEAADKDGAVIVRGVPEYLVKSLSNLAPDLHDHPRRSRGVPVKTAQRRLFDAFRRQISFSSTSISQVEYVFPSPICLISFPPSTDMTKKQQRAVKAYAHWMHSVGFPCEQIKLLVSFPGGVQQGVHIDSEMVSGTALGSLWGRRERGAWSIHPTDSPAQVISTS